jgi:hypothetical protein
MPHVVRAGPGAVASQDLVNSYCYSHTLAPRSHGGSTTLVPDTCSPTLYTSAGGTPGPHSISYKPQAGPSYSMQPLLGLGTCLGASSGTYHTTQHVAVLYDAVNPCQQTLTQVPNPTTGHMVSVQKLLGAAKHQAVRYTARRRTVHSTTPPLFHHMAGRGFKTDPPSSHPPAIVSLDDQGTQLVHKSDHTPLFALTTMYTQPVSPYQAPDQCDVRMHAHQCGCTASMPWPTHSCQKNGGGNQVTALLVTLWDATQG